MANARIAWRVAALARACEVCGAPPGEDCHTESGARAYTPHVYRTRLASATGWTDPDNESEDP